MHCPDYLNPTRQRGIFPNTVSNAKAQSLGDAAGWDGRKTRDVKTRDFPL
jgi:hypothetical protein